MGKLLEKWLKLLEGKMEIMYPELVDHTLKRYQELYEEDQGPDPFTDKVENLMRAFNKALSYDRPIPEWVIKGLNSDKRLQKYRPLPPKSGEIEWLDSSQVLSQLPMKDLQKDLQLASYLSNGELGYYVKTGKWMSEGAQAVREKEIITYKGDRVHLLADGWTWVDAGEITFDKILANLSDLAFSKEDVIEFETRHTELVGKSPSPATRSEPTEDYVQFVRSLRVSYESDSEIKIKEPGKPTKVFFLRIVGIQR